MKWLWVNRRRIQREKNVDFWSLDIVNGDMTLKVKWDQWCSDCGYGKCGIEPEGTSAHRKAAAHVLVSLDQAMAAALIPAHVLSKGDQRSRPIPSAGRTQTRGRGS